MSALSNENFNFLADALLALQNRFAASLRPGSAVLVSASISDWNGRVYDTIEANEKTATGIQRPDDFNQVYANAIALNNFSQRMAAIGEAAFNIYNLVGGEGYVVTVTYQFTTPAWPQPKVTDNFVQVFQKNGLVQTKIQALEDNRW